jgi:uncharacterized protein YcfJ
VGWYRLALVVSLILTGRGAAAGQAHRIVVIPAPLSAPAVVVGRPAVVVPRAARVVRLAPAPRVCWNEVRQYAYPVAPQSATPTLLGAIAGGVVGSQLGSGAGTAAMTAAGALLGGSIGHDLTPRPPVEIRSVVERHCRPAGGVSYRRVGVPRVVCLPGGY